MSRHSRGLFAKRSETMVGIIKEVAPTLILTPTKAYVRELSGKGGVQRVTSANYALADVKSAPYCGADLYKNRFRASNNRST